MELGSKTCKLYKILVSKNCRLLVVMCEIIKIIMYEKTFVIYTVYQSNLCKPYKKSQINFCLHLISPLITSSLDKIDIFESLLGIHTFLNKTNKGNFDVLCHQWKYTKLYSQTYKLYKILFYTNC